MDKRRKNWLPLSEVYFCTTIPFPGEPKNLLSRGEGFEYVKDLDRDMDSRCIRIRIKRGNVTKTHYVPFENVLCWTNAVTQKKEDG